MVQCPVIGCEDDPDDLSWQTFVESCLCARHSEVKCGVSAVYSFVSFSVGGYIQKKCYSSRCSAGAVGLPRSLEIWHFGNVPAV